MNQLIQLGELLVFTIIMCSPMFLYFLYEDWVLRREIRKYVGLVK